MTEMPSYVVENPKFEPYKPKKQYNNLYSSLLPILLSIFIYILCFHVLDVSPSSVFNDTKILFIISNALIIIIAADYGSFTAKEDHDFYGEYMAAMRNDARENPRLQENAGYGVSLAEDIRNRSVKQEEAVGAKDIQIQHRYLPNKEAKVPERTVQVVSENQPKNIAIGKYEPVTEPNIHKTATKEENCDARKLVNPKPYGRSKSDKVRGRVSMIIKERRQEIKHRPKGYDRSQWDSSKWMVVHKGRKADEEMEKATQKWENVREDSEEFSKMSNEELNRRVEDFIQRFNRDIKRQSF